MMILTKGFDDNGMSMSSYIHMRKKDISFFFILEKTTTKTTTTII